MRKQFLRFVLIIPLLLLPATGCSFVTNQLEGELSSRPEEGFVQTSADFKHAPKRLAMRGASSEPAAGSVMEEGDTELAFDRKVIYSGDIGIEVKSCDESIKEIKTIVTEADGVVADTSITEVDEGYKTADVVIRVPADSFEKVLDRLGSLGKVKSQSSHGDDITEKYYDLQARLDNAKNMEARLVDLLQNKSKNLKDMLDVEKELGRIREKIERLEGKKRYFDQHVAMSTINIHLKEPYKYSAGILDPVKKAIDKAGEYFMKSLGAVLLFLAAAVPWFILIGVIIYVIMFFIKRWIRNIRKRKDIKITPKQEPKKSDPDEEEEW